MERGIKSFLLFFIIKIFLQFQELAYNSDPEQFIAEIIDDAKVILSGKNSSEKKAELLSEIALKTVDIKGLAYYTLGSKRKRN